MKFWQSRGTVSCSKLFDFVVCCPTLGQQDLLGINGVVAGPASSSLTPESRITVYRTYCSNHISLPFCRVPSFSVDFRVFCVLVP